MKEDICEQFVEDWLVSEPDRFAKHKVKFRPNSGNDGYRSKQDSMYSDIGFLAISGVLAGQERVRVVTCKSWQGGFDPRTTLATLETDAGYNERSDKVQPREKWKYYRELVSNKWMAAFDYNIEDETGQRDFENIVAVTKLRGTREGRRQLEQSAFVQQRFQNLDSKMSLKLLPLVEIIDGVLKRQGSKETSAVESTDVGRLIQVLHAARIDFGSGGDLRD
jgi:hypothetical protein